MPPRTTPFQKIVRLVREHFAHLDVTVTESRMFRDPQTGLDREVDIVVEGTFDGDVAVTSIEVVEKKRRASITWVEQMIAKHRYLPTTRLILVSQSGFSESALRLVEAQGGSVEAASPELVLADGKPIVKRLYADQIKAPPSGATLILGLPSGDWAQLPEAAADLEVYGPDLHLRGCVGQLASELVRLNQVVMRMSQMAHGHPKRESLSSFEVAAALRAMGCRLRNEQSGEFHIINAILVRGPFAWRQIEIPLTVQVLSNRYYASASVDMFGTPVVWVGTDDHQNRLTKFSWRPVAGGQRARPVSQVCFPELEALDLTVLSEEDELEAASLARSESRVTVAVNLVSGHVKTELPTDLG